MRQRLRICQCPHVFRGYRNRGRGNAASKANSEKNCGLEQSVNVLRPFPPTAKRRNITNASFLCQSFQMQNKMTTFLHSSSRNQLLFFCHLLFGIYQHLNTPFPSANLSLIFPFLDRYALKIRALFFRIVESQEYSVIKQSASAVPDEEEEGEIGAYVQFPYLSFSIPSIFLSLPLPPLENSRVTTPSSILFTFSGGRRKNLLLPVPTH